MKSAALILVLLTLAPPPASAQLFSRNSVGGAALGGLAGGIIGHNNGRKTAEGAAIGAGAGLLLGSLVHQSRRESAPIGYSSYVSYAPAPSPVYYSPAPVVYGYARPHRAVTGAVVGGLAGGVIGHNKGRHTAEGAAIGAGAGLLLGAISEHKFRRRAYARPVPVYLASEPAPVVQAPSLPLAEPAPAPVQPAPLIAPVGGRPSSMTSANALFGR